MFKKKKLMAVLVAVAMVSALFAVNGASANTYWQYWTDGIGYVNATNGALP